MMNHYRLLIAALFIFAVSGPCQAAAKTYHWDDYSKPFDREFRLSGSAELEVSLPREFVEKHDRIPLVVSYRRKSTDFFISLRVNDQSRWSPYKIGRQKDGNWVTGSERILIDKKYLKPGRNRLIFEFETKSPSMWYLDITAVKFDIEGIEKKSSVAASGESKGIYRWEDYTEPFDREFRFSGTAKIEVNLPEDIINRNERVPLLVSYRERSSTTHLSLLVNDQPSASPYILAKKPDGTWQTETEEVSIDPKYLKPGTNQFVFKVISPPPTYYPYMDIISIKFDFDRAEGKSPILTTNKKSTAPAETEKKPEVEKPKPAAARVIKPEPVFVPPVAGVRWAVVIGVSNYQDSRIPSLRYANKDARAFYDWLVSPNGGRYALGRVKLLVDNDATGVGIRNSLFEWLGQALEEDVVTIFFAGHGSPQSPDNPENLFLLPFDTDYDSVATTGFPMWDIETALKRFIRAKKVIVIADACHAGGVGQAFDVARRAGRGVNTVTISSNLQHLTKIGDGICIISASDDSQFSQESKKWGGGHGVFTYYLLRGLKGEADYSKDSRVTLGEIVPYLSEQVRRATRNAQSPTVAGRFDPALTIGK
jgi:hypothetical protein